MRRAFTSLLAVVVLAFGACTDRANTDAQLEIAAELRALRTALQPAEGRPPQPAPVFEGEAFRAALEPLRDVMTALARDLDAMHGRQAALTQELQRWSQLLAQSVTAGNKAEAEALATRLAGLEQAMQAQDARHRQVEDLIGGALEMTSARLEGFLQRLEAMGKDPNATPTKNSGTDDGGQAPTKAPAGNGGEVEKAEKNGGDEDEPDKQASLGGRRRGGTEPSSWWFAIAAAALLAGGMFAFWLRRENAAATRLRSPLDEPGIDGGTQELWQAAALLGEAVGRLKQTGEAAAGEPEFEAPDDDYFVVDDFPEPTPTGVDIEPAPAPAPEPVPEPLLTPAPAVTAAGPPRITLHLGTADPGRAIPSLLAALAADPRVLRRPEPIVSASAGRIEVTFYVLPDLPAGERGHLEQALRGRIA